MPGAAVFVLTAGLFLQGAPDGVQAAPDSGREVRVYATAADERGRPVEDLSRADFLLTEEGEERVIDDVRFVDPRTASNVEGAPREIESRADERVEAARDGTRLFAVLLDEYHVTPGASADRVRAALRRFIAERTSPRDLVVVFKPLDSLLEIRLTRDRAEAAEAVDTFTGRKRLYEPRTAFERDFLASDPARADAMRAQISTAALNGLVTHLGGLEAGRKILVVVSEGVDGDEWARRLETIARAANRAGVSIYPVNPDIAAEGGQSDGWSRLVQLSEATGGRAISGADSIDAGLDRMSGDLRGYYVLTFRSQALTRDRLGAVNVSTVRPGVVLRASRGHSTPSEPETAGGENAGIPGGEIMAAPVRRTSPLIRPWFGVARASDGLSRVSFVWEPAPPTPGRPQSRRTPARVSLRVSSQDGTAIFDGIVGPAGAADAGEPSRADFHAPPGRLQVEMRIEDQDARYLDFDIRDVTVASHDAPIALGTAQVFRSRNAREFRELEGNPEALPVAAREFSRAERLLVRVPVAAKEGTPTVTATLATAFGGVMRTLAALDGPRADLRQFDLPLATLVAGDYRLEIRADVSGVQATEVVPLRVRP